MKRRVDPITAVIVAVIGVCASALVVGTFVADAELDGGESAVIGVAVVVACAAVLFFLRRHGHEEATLLFAQPKDERQTRISERAGNVTGIMACLASSIGYVVSAFTGAHAEAQAFGIMASICGGTLVVATAVIRRRS